MHEIISISSFVSDGASELNEKADHEVVYIFERL
jgi:hypothetical protein